MACLTSISPSALSVCLKADVLQLAVNYAGTNAVPTQSFLIVLFYGEDILKREDSLAKMLPDVWTELRDERF